MKENGLTLQQEEKLTLLLKIIQEQSGLSLKEEPLLVKIPFETLKESGINKAEVRHFIQYLNKNIGIIKPETLWINILNGTIAKYGDEIVSQVDQEIDPLSGVSLEDEEDSFILQIYNWKLFSKKAESFWDVDISKSKQKSYYKNNEILIGKRKLEIKPNSRYASFCEIMFNVDPKTDIGYGDIWERIEGIKDDEGKLGGVEKKSIENLVANLNKKLKDKGIKQSLFSQQKPVVYRNY